MIHILFALSLATAVAQEAPNRDRPNVNAGWQEGHGGANLEAEFRETVGHIADVLDRSNNPELAAIDRAGFRHAGHDIAIDVETRRPRCRDRYGRLRERDACYDPAGSRYPARLRVYEGFWDVATPEARARIATHETLRAAGLGRLDEEYELTTRVLDVLRNPPPPPPRPALARLRPGRYGSGTRCVLRIETIQRNGGETVAHAEWASWPDEPDAEYLPQDFCEFSAAGDLVCGADSCRFSWGHLRREETCVQEIAGRCVSRQTRYPVDHYQLNLYPLDSGSLRGELSIRPAGAGENAPFRQYRVLHFQPALRGRR